MKKKKMTLEDLAKIIQEEFAKFNAYLDEKFALYDKKQKERDLTGSLK